jgi:hypothetical protein
MYTDVLDGLLGVSNDIDAFYGNRPGAEQAAPVIGDNSSGSSSDLSLEERLRGMGVNLGPQADASNQVTADDGTSSLEVWLRMLGVNVEAGDEKDTAGESLSIGGNTIVASAELSLEERLAMLRGDHVTSSAGGSSQNAAAAANTNTERNKRRDSSKPKPVKKQPIFGFLADKVF